MIPIFSFLLQAFLFFSCSLVFADETTFDIGTHEIFAAIKSGSCGTGLTLSATTLELTDTRYFTEFDSTVFLDKMNIYHRKFHQKLYQYSMSNSRLTRTGTSKYQVEWYFDTNKTVAQRFADAVEYGENVTWLIYYSSALQATVNGTWNFASGSGLTKDALKNGAEDDPITDNYALWGGPEYEVTEPLDASSSSFSISSSGFTGVVVYAGSSSSQTTQCSTAYRTGSSFLTSSSSTKFATIFYVENLSNITDCEVSDWTDYTDCSGECGIGIYSRTREILKSPSVGGKSCPSVYYQENECDTGISCAPKTVHNLTCISFGSGSAKLNWSEAMLYDDSYAISGYSVKGRVSGGSWKYHVDDSGTNSTETVISNLQPSTTYEFAVAAINSEGSGDFSSLCDVSTDNTPTVQFQSNGLSVLINYGVDLTDCGFDLSSTCNISDLLPVYEKEKFGSNTDELTCTFLSSKTVSIGLLSGALINVGSNITIMTGFLYDDETSNTTVSAGDWIDTAITTSYSSTSSHCSPWFIDLRGSVVPGGRVLTPSIDIVVSSITMITAGNTSLSVGDVIGDDFYSDFPAYYFSPVEQLGLNITVTTFFGRVDKLMIMVNFVTEEVVSMQFSCGNNINMYSYESREVSVMPIFSDCYIANNGQVDDENTSYSWMISENDLNFTDIADFGIYSLLRGKRIIIPVFSLSMSSKYVVRVSSIGFASETEATFTINVASTYPSAIIIGGSLRRASRFEEFFSVDGSLSYDPSECYFQASCYDYLIYSWLCYYDTDGQSCGSIVTTTVTAGNNTYYAKQPDIVFLNLSSLWRGDKEKIVIELSLTSNSSALRSTAYQYISMLDVTGSELTQPSLTLPDVVNSNDNIFLGGSSSSNQNKRYVMDGVDDAYISSSYRYLNSSLSILAGSALTYDENYLVTFYCGSDYARSLIYVNEPPEGGSMSFSNGSLISRTNFVAFNESISILTEGWVDETLPLLYSFELLINNTHLETWVPLNLDASSNYVSSLYLSIGEWQIKVQVCDSYGAKSILYDVVSVASSSSWTVDSGYDNVFSTSSTSNSIFLAASSIQQLTEMVFFGDVNTSAINTTFAASAAYHLLDSVEEQFDVNDKHEILHLNYQVHAALEHLANVYILMSQVERAITTERILSDYFHLVEEAITSIDSGEYDQETCNLFLALLDELEILVGEKYLVQYFEHIFKTECGLGVFVWEEETAAIIVSSSKSTLYRFALLNVSSSVSMIVNYDDYPSSSAGTRPTVSVTIPDSLLQSSSYDYLDLAVTDLSTAERENSTISFASNWFSLIAFDASLPEDFISCNKWVGASNDSCSMEVTTKSAMNLTKPIIIEIPLYWKASKTKLNSLSCVWFNETSGGADTSGCEITNVDADNGYAICECDKIATYAVGAISIKQSDCELTVEEETELSLIYESTWYMILKYAFMVGYFIIAIINCISFVTNYFTEKGLSVSALIFLMFIPISLIRLAYFITLFSLDTSSACLENLSVVDATNPTFLLVAFLHDLSPPLNLLGYSGIFVFWLKVHQKIRYNLSGVSKIAKRDSMMIYIPFFVNIAYCFVYYGSLAVIAGSLGGEALIAFATKVVNMFSLALYSSISVAEACVLQIAGRKLISMKGDNQKMDMLWKLLQIGSIHFYVMAGILIVVAIKNQNPDSPPTLSAMQHVLLFSFGYNLVELSLNIFLSMALFNKRKQSPNSMNEELSAADKKGSVEMMAQYRIMQETRDLEKKEKKKRRKKRRKMRKQRCKRNLFDEVEENLECEVEIDSPKGPTFGDDEEEDDIEVGNDDGNGAEGFRKASMDYDDDDFEFDDIHPSDDALSESNPMQRR